jgi:hypothetical protein
MYIYTNVCLLESRNLVYACFVPVKRKRLLPGSDAEPVHLFFGEGGLRLQLITNFCSSSCSEMLKLLMLKFIKDIIQRCGSAVLADQVHFDRIRTDMTLEKIGSGYGSNC